MALAGTGFVGPLLFGGIVDALASGGAPGAIWRRILLLLGAWAVVGIGGIAAGILDALHADRLAQRRRLVAMSRYFEHVLQLPQAFHADSHSGRQLKIMWQGADTLFGTYAMSRSAATTARTRADHNDHHARAHDFPD